MTDDPVIVALLETVASLEAAPDNLVNPDFAVALLEEIAHRLRQSPLAERRRILEVARELAAQTDELSSREALAALPEGLGLLADG